MQARGARSVRVSGVKRVDNQSHRDEFRDVIFPIVCVHVCQVQRYFIPGMGRQKQPALFVSRTRSFNFQGPNRSSWVWGQRVHAVI